MSKKTATLNPALFANAEGLVEKLIGWVGDQFKGNSIILVCVSGNARPVVFPFAEMGQDWRFTRALVLFERLPIDLEVVGLWREWVMQRGAWDLRMAFLHDGVNEASIKNVIETNCDGWFEAPPSRENLGIKRGACVRMPAKTTVKDDPSLLTMMFGSMGEFLTQVEVVACRFREAVNKGLRKDKAVKYLKEIDELLAGKAKSGVLVPGPLGVEDRTDHLPRLLLRGESGVGKTLIASYLHNKTGLEARSFRPLHISIPEYLGKEDMFEYTLFGYAEGNYTGGKQGGDHGLLLHNVGGVVFLDEIGEANASLQAKLLTFLDHYKVRPRGWLGDPFYCPVLVVAATNRDLEEVVDGKPIFRRDLIARFTDRHRIPALRDRMEDLPFILDCLLQRESMNPEGRVQEIGQDAVAFLKSKTFEAGNFRELEDLFRSACHKAHRECRSYLVKADLEE